MHVRRRQFSLLALFLALTIAAVAVRFWTVVAIVVGVPLLLLSVAAYLFGPIVAFGWLLSAEHRRAIGRRRQPSQRRTEQRPS